MAGEKTEVEGRVFDSPYTVADATMKEPVVLIGRVPFELEEHQFTILKNPSSGATWLSVVGGAALALSLNVIGKLIAKSLFGKDAPETWEYAAAALSVALTFLVWVALAFVKTERSRLVSLIKQHFEASPPRRVHVIPEDQ